MRNCFRMTPDGSLDRPFLRASAVYRCAKRYGASREWVIARLTESARQRRPMYSPILAAAMADMWGLKSKPAKLQAAA